MVAGHRHHVADPRGPQSGPQGRVVAVDLVTGHPGRGRPRRPGRHRSSAAPTPVSWRTRHRSGYRRRRTAPGRRPRTWQVQGTVDQRMTPRRGVRQIHCDLGVLDPTGGAGVLPLHPDSARALLQISGFVNHQNPGRVVEGSTHIAAQIVADRVSSHFARDSRCCSASGFASPRCSAIVQQFFRSNPDSRPCINAPACRAGSYLANRGLIRSCSAPNSSHHRSGSTLWTAAGDAFFVVFTTTDDHAPAALTCGNTPKNPIYPCRTRLSTQRKPRARRPGRHEVGSHRSESI